MRYYLDANATLPAKNLRAWADTFTDVGNPSSLHIDGQRAKKVLNTSREIISQYFKADPYDCFFTSGASESLSLLIQGFASKNKNSLIVHTEADHAAVLGNIEYLRKKDHKITTLKVNDQGHPTELIPADLLIVTASNNETGVLFPLELLKKYKDQNTFILMDAVQVPGKVDNAHLYYELADAIVISGHKLGAPAGIGFVVNTGLDVEPLIRGGKQERNRRAGTENLFGVHCLAKVFEDLPKFDETLRNYFEENLISAFPDVIIHGKKVKRAKNTSNFHIPGTRSTLMMALDQAGFSVSLGSACASGAIAPSHVILAMTHSEEIGQASIRVSFCPDSTKESADKLVETLINVLRV